MQYSDIQDYGFNLIIKDYARYPRWLPLPCHIEHGWTPLTDPLVTDLNVDKPLMLVYSKRRFEAWKKKSTKPVAIMGSPFIHYRKMRHIEQQPGAKGTIAFPVHRTVHHRIDFDVKQYCAELKRLPRDFQPITVCLFWLDYIDKSADIYREAGLNIVTAGPRFRQGLDFVRNLYQLISNHKYATSNEVGSSAFYAVELGIPFFLLGEPPLTLNETGEDKNMGKSSKLDQFTHGAIATKIFSTGPVTKISPKQMKYVTDEMGIDDCLTPNEMRQLLWKHLTHERRWMLGVIIYWVISILIFCGLANFCLGIVNYYKQLSKKTRKKQ